MHINTSDPFVGAVIVLVALALIIILVLLANRPQPQPLLMPGADEDNLRRQVDTKQNELRDARRQWNTKVDDRNTENRRRRIHNWLVPMTLGLGLIALLIAWFWFIDHPGAVTSVKDAAVTQPATTVPSSVAGSTAVTKDDLRQISAEIKQSARDVRDEIPVVVNRELDKRLPVTVTTAAPKGDVTKADLPALPTTTTPEQQAINEKNQRDIGMLNAKTSGLGDRITDVASTMSTGFSNLGTKLDNLANRPPEIKVIRKTIVKREKPVIIYQAAPDPSCFQQGVDYCTPPVRRPYFNHY